jgi:hypothetical protein
MVSNGVVNSSFQLSVSKFDCSLSAVYTYTQTNQLYSQNAPYYLVLSDYP